MEEIKGYVDHIIFRNETNKYTVLLLSSEYDDITCVGIFPSVSQGENLLLCGEFVDHATYGEQFSVKSYKSIPPQGTVAIERYLASGIISGVGPALAKRIVKKFKEDTFRIIEEEPERLAEVKGISLDKAQKIAVTVMEQKEVRDVMMYLEEYGITGALAVKVYDKYGPDTYEIVKTNPYKMAEDISGVGFKRADEIAANIGIKVDSEYRIRCGLLYVLSQAISAGHTYLPKDILLEKSRELLAVEIGDISIHLDNLSMDRRIVQRDDCVFLTAYYNMEQKSAIMLNSLRGAYSLNNAAFKRMERQIEKNDGIVLDEKQKDAVRSAIESGVCVLTGGPGTGKTTIIKAILYLLEEEQLDVALCAPTGRAAKRMSEATGYVAKTVHRLLAVSGDVDDDENLTDVASDYRGKFAKNALDPLEYDVVIVDEASMLDTVMLYHLLCALQTECKLILVGDANQLPSVGAGNVLADIIDSEAFCVVKLDKIFRQASQSDIVNNAHIINNGGRVDLKKESEDFYFVRRGNPQEITSAALKMINGSLPDFVGADKFDIQVITPTRNGWLGVFELNKTMQESLNPPSEEKNEIESLNRIFREGDKVMQIKNNYRLEWEIRGKNGVIIETGTGVFNGDMGTILDVDTYSKTVTVEFDESRVVEYTQSALDELELAYAITIHKSQGSEYPAVIIPLFGVPRPLVNRNLIYTAITRARKCVIIIGSEEIFNEMVMNNHRSKRYTYLCDLIIEEGEVE